MVLIVQPVMGCDGSGADGSASKPFATPEGALAFMKHSGWLHSRDVAELRDCVLVRCNEKRERAEAWGMAAHASVIGCLPEICSKIHSLSLAGARSGCPLARCQSPSCESGPICFAHGFSGFGSVVQTPLAESWGETEEGSNSLGLAIVFERQACTAQDCYAGLSFSPARPAHKTARPCCPCDLCGQRNNLDRCVRHCS
jgi:hypothetical protein